jgi:hypothetical protein
MVLGVYVEAPGVPSACVARAAYAAIRQCQGQGSNYVVLEMYVEALGVPVLVSIARAAEAAP